MNSVRKTFTELSASEHAKRQRRIMIGFIIIVLVALIMFASAYVMAVVNQSHQTHDTINQQKNDHSIAVSVAKFDKRKAGQFIVDLAKQLDAKTFKANFFNTTEGRNLLTKMSKGDTTSIPQPVKQAFIYSQDAQQSTTIAYPDIQAASYAALIALQQQFLASGSGVNDGAINTNAIFLDHTTGVATVPAEALTGTPADLVFYVRLDGNNYRIVGDNTGMQILVKARAAALQSQVQQQQQAKQDAVTPQQTPQKQ